jgi:hypothetical protein
VRVHVQLATPMGNTLGEPGLNFAFDPADSACGEVDPLRKAILGLELIDRRGAKAGHLADLLQPQDLQRGRTCLYGDHGHSSGAGGVLRGELSLSSRVHPLA